ncbi:hypothetical protein K8I31_12515 [bacterium]|nr:hypothetical protein [bacterium]
MKNVIDVIWYLAIGLFVSSSVPSWSVEPKMILPADMAKYTLEHSSIPRINYGDDIIISKKEDGSISIANQKRDGAVSVPLYLYEDPGFEAETIIYSAEIKSDKTDMKAYLEMLCTFPDEKTYFSRGVSQSLSGATTWEKQQTPFFLKAGQRPTRITVGVRFEEPGVILIRNIDLFKADNSVRSSLYFYQFVMPRLLGGIYGFWGAAIGIIGGTMIPRGRFKKLVLTLLVSMGLFSIAIAVLGFTLQQNTGIPSNIINQYYISAAIGLVLSIVFIPMVLKQYQAVELRKMQAKDIG